MIETFEDTCRHIIQIYLAELGRHGLKIVLLYTVDNPKLSMSEHKQNEIINASTFTRIETSSSTDMDYDVTKISPLQLDKRGQIVSPPTTANHDFKVNY